MSINPPGFGTGPWYSRKWAIVIVHSIAWVLLFSLPYLLRPPFEANKALTVNPDDRVLNLLHRVVEGWLVFSFYLNALLLMPRLAHRRRWWIFALAHLGLFSVLFWGNWIFVATVAVHTPLLWQPILFFSLYPYLFVFASSTAYQSIRERLKAQRRQKEKENENLRSELSLLRSQVSPHFMFNILNNMVALARKGSEELEPSLIKLSRLLRYMLYETDEEKVPLEKEIEYLQAYIDLQSQRFGHNVKVKVEMKMEGEGYVIEPMLLIPFVENAFKHGTGMIRNAQIDIQLKAVDGALSFVVRNKFDPASVETRDKTRGIGLPNVRRRLNLLYDQKYCLLSRVDDNFYITSLKINFRP